MTEQFMFADTEAGLSSAFALSLTLRRSGFKTRLAARTIGTTVLQIVYATPAARLSRKERGLFVKPRGK